tara:strand:+ start:18 stop:1553 length:1536 start_codon:yes stop_codon:yes gene_type:complete
MKNFNLRFLYLFFVALFGYLLFYAYTSEQNISNAVVQEEVSTNYLSSFNESQIHILENSVLEIVVDTVNGNILSSRLKDYPVVPGSDGGVRVLGSGLDSDGEQMRFYMSSGFVDLESAGLSNKPGFTIEESSKEKIVLKSGGLLKTISLSDGYRVSIKDSLNSSVVLKPYAQMLRTTGRGFDLDDMFISRSSYVGVAFNTKDDPYVSYRFRNIDNVSFDERGGWVASVQKYFLAALVGSQENLYRYFAREPSDGSDIYSFGYIVESSNNNSFEHTLYIGPKIRKDLIAVAEDLELTIDMGWFWFLAQPLAALLTVINGFVNNWGLSIIALTILIKVVFWPLTGKGFRSMANMRRVQPEMQRIQERYKNDRQKLSMEMMTLYKKEGVNPMGGCLPMLASFPFFIALFFVLRESLELRHAPFGLWLQDLSAPDPFFVLPVLMAVLMYLTTRLNPTPPNADPTQVAVMKFMPVGISVLFIFFPSGLVLYSVANSGVQLIQQTMLYRELGALEDK